MFEKREMNSRKMVVRPYRYGFNGQEKDDEIKGAGNHNSALFWGYDTRLGRRWNLDPKAQINISDYACFGDNPSWFVDPLGNDKYKVDREGHITLKKTTNKDYDKLVSSGSVFNNSIKLDKGILSSRETKPISMYGVPGSFDVYRAKSSAQGSSLFEFLARNTDVEWSHLKLGEGGMQSSILSTSHGSIGEPGGATLLQDDILLMSLSGYDHNHPDGSKIATGSIFELGSPEFRDGDVGMARELISRKEDILNHGNRMSRLMGDLPIKLNAPVLRIYTADDKVYTTFDANTYHPLSTPTFER